MTTYSDAEERWFGELRPRVVEYIARQGVKHGRIGEIPAWFVDPYVSIWAVESGHAPGRVGWWIICGDCPTDYVACTGDRTPRSAVETIVVRWREGAAAMLRGEEPVDWTVGNSENGKELAELLARRATLLDEWTRDDQLWI